MYIINFSSYKPCKSFIELFDKEDQTSLAKTLIYHVGRILSLCWHKDGQILVAGGSDATIRVYEVSTGEINN